ncbi:hypothetical protein [Actinomadura rubrisoli]|uniref:Uncharacterized protein n=1 Tax=Actinomadura rubrisoli TaxID=2530368 RepID=A0A4R4ZYU3_9ACTN|nr:hypothetical protein [Actinomadura rubrisoli]TDD64483.1 hypothetical protein E1298_42340 [Actinomadura rubrisoli]
MSFPPSQGGQSGSHGFPDLPPPPPIPGGPKPPREGYEPFTRQPVFYLPVLLRGELVGYLWAAESNAKAAGFIRRLELPEPSLDAAGFWALRLTEAYDEGLPAREAIRRWIGAPEDAKGGAVPPSAREQRASGTAELSELLNPGIAHQPGPLVQDGLFPDGTPVDRSQGWGPLISTAPPSYPVRTAGPVVFLPVTRAGSVVGYVWASVTGDAASYLGRQAAGRDGEIAAGLWKARLAHLFGERVPAVEALRRLKGLPEHPLAGEIAADAQEAQAANLGGLERLAQQ